MLLLVQDTVILSHCTCVCFYMGGNVCVYGLCLYMCVCMCVSDWTLRCSPFSCPTSLQWNCPLLRGHARHRRHHGSVLHGHNVLVATHLLQHSGQAVQVPIREMLRLPQVQDHSCWTGLGGKVVQVPVQVEFVRQHPPVVAAGLGGVQAAAELLANGEGNAEGIGPHQRGDVTGRVQQRGVDALGVLRQEGTDG